MSSISTPYYKSLDFTLVFLACSIAYWLRFDTFSLPLYYFLPTAIFATLATFSLSITGFYQPINSSISYDQTISAAFGLITAATITTACLYLTKTGEDYSRIWLVTSTVLSLIALTSVRLLLKKIFRISSPQRFIVLIGNGSTPDFILEHLNRASVVAISVAKHFAMRNCNLDSIKKVVEFIEEYRIDSKIRYPITEIWITHSVFSKLDSVQLKRSFENSAAKLVYIAELPESLMRTEQDIQLLAGIPTINAESSKRHKIDRLLKLIEDQMIAWLVMLVMWPILLVIAVSIKLESSGPIIYRQVRYGLGGKEFLIWKFRTMYDTESTEQFIQATKGDSRITKVGKFLRRTSLDELPQLFNVISGSMSIVGPRPHPVKLNEQHRQEINEYMHRHTSKPGITGLAQIKGFRGETSTPELMEQRVKYDLEYVRNWNIFLDIKIIILTFAHLISTDKAH